MTLRWLAFGALLVWPNPAPAQAQPYPAGLVARAAALNGACRAANGRVVNIARPLVVRQDLTGDGRPEFILDEAGFGCSTRSFSVVTRAGAPIEVFDGADGRSLYRGMVAGWQVLQGPRPQVMLTLRGATCGPNAFAATTCQRPLVWNLRTRTLAGPPAGQTARAEATPAPTAKAAPSAAPPTSLSEADKAAVFRAAGFKRVGPSWKRCEEDPTASYRPGALQEVLDLNGDGLPEAVVTEGSQFCHGQEGAWFAVLSRDTGGTWRQVLESDGIFVAMPSLANGWQEVMIGGPGFTHPVYRFDGRRYVHNREVRE